MAYRFNGTSDFVEFALGPFTSHTFGAFTWAALFKRNGLASVRAIVSFNDSTNATALTYLRFASTDVLQWLDNSAGSSGGGTTMNSTAVWYIAVGTRAAGATTIRVHVWDGSTWNHAAGTGAITDVVLGTTNRLRVGDRANVSKLTADLVCVGIKKTDSADLTVETLNATAFSSWTGFGFDWLIGFDTSLQTAGALQDQATPGTGDQTAISGTTVVSDPPGWTWAGGGGGGPVYVPRVIVI